MATKVTKAKKTTAASTKAASSVKAKTQSEEKPVSAGKNLPKELFGGKVNKAILAQYVRVFLANQREGSARTKTRGMVEGSTRKIYRQKGTGRARHGSIRAPIFVGGGIVFGPVARDYHLTMSKDMKRKALLSAFAARVADTVVVDGIEDAEKTKAVAGALKSSVGMGNVLFIVPKAAEKLVRASRNIKGVDVVRATDVNPYEVLTHKTIVFTKSALEESKVHFTN